MVYPSALFFQITLTQAMHTDHIYGHSKQAISHSSPQQLLCSQGIPAPRSSKRYRTIHPRKTSQRLPHSSQPRLQTLSQQTFTASEIQTANLHPLGYCLHGNANDRAYSYFGALASRLRFPLEDIVALLLRGDSCR